MLDLEILVNNFWLFVRDQNVELYNEFSLQHELGIFLRGILPDYKIQFERNVSFFGIPARATIKKEIDISIFTPDKKERYAIELKYPRNGQYPEQMYAFTKDLLFMEQLKDNGFLQTCVVTLVEDRPFYAGDQQSGIYSYFRGGAPLTGRVFKPTGSTKGIEHIDLAGNYVINWSNLDAKRRYYILTVG